MDDRGTLVPPVLYMNASDGQIFRFNRPTEEQLRQRQVEALASDARTAIDNRNYPLALQKLQAIQELQPETNEPASLNSTCFLVRSSGLALKASRQAITRLVAAVTLASLVSPMPRTWRLRSSEVLALATAE